MPESARIVVERLAGQRRDMYRKYRVEVDGQDVGILTPGGAIDVDVSAGSHHVEVRIDWMGSCALTVEVEPAETVRLTCRANGGTGSAMADMVLGTLRRRPWIDLAVSTE